MGWEKLNIDNLPSIREPVYAYAADGSLLLVCLVWEENQNTSWDLGEDYALSWALLRETHTFPAGEIFPFRFITHISDFDPTDSEEPSLPKLEELA